MQQRTIQQPINLEGIGLHSGNPVHLRFSPAPIDYGIQFLRSDVAQAKPIPAIYHAVTDTMMSSNLTNELGQRIGTVEHLMSAIAALQIDNLQIEVSAPEIPIMDGSSKPFVQEIKRVGKEEQQAERLYLELTENIKWEDVENAEVSEADKNHPLLKDVKALKADEL